ncbi:SDR family NAD(P)-dependent oxidoreductase [Nocardia beijingensis]|uniref:SDR family NAD(P)-dependent oxidoreductase n=1 Tax=Nocardia beijingensis TaxID=95162 RepID=UPI0033D3B28D
MPSESKTVLITGASGGVGQATVNRLDGMGWQVFAGVRSLDAGKRLAHGSRRVIPVRLDVCDEGSLAEARAEIDVRLGGQGLDALINNAGLSVDGPIELLPETALRRQFDVNVVGKIATTRVFLPLLRQAGGRVVNIGGASGRMTLPMFGALGAGTAALDSLTDALRMELRYQGVQVSYIEPGGLQTEFFGKSAQEAKNAGYAGGPEVQQLYRKAIDASTKALAESRKSPVEAAVAAIVKALTARRPASRYVVGTQAKYGMPILLRLPIRWRDRVLMSTLGLQRQMFAPIESSR